jgi:lysophospholipase L1-like esterase
MAAYGVGRTRRPNPGKGVYGKELMARLLAVVVLVISWTGLAACSPGTETGEQSTDETPVPRTAHREATGALERTSVAEGGAGATRPDAPATLDYVALGDSLAAGVGARRGYVDRYAEHLRADTGARVRVVNLGVSGQTSLQLLHALRKVPATRRALRGAEVVTFNIGINDLGQARGSYGAGTCGGAQGERCLRRAVEALESNWDAIVREISTLRPADEAVIRTTGLGYTPRAEGVFEPYLREVTRHIATSAADNGIPYAEVRLREEEMGQDGVHPNDRGYRVMAERLRTLGYEPLGPN